MTICAKNICIAEEILPKRLNHCVVIFIARLNSIRFKYYKEKNDMPVVAAHLRGMRPTPSSDKDILKPNGKLKTLNTTD